jgi:hypothetical protein
MHLLAYLRLSLWICALGAIVLFVFFVSLARIPPAEVAGATTAVTVLAGLLAVRGWRLSSELADPGGDPRLRRALNHQRELRGF